MNTRTTFLAVVLAVAAAVGGCKDSSLTSLMLGEVGSGGTRNLGAVDYAAAFGHAREIMAQYGFRLVETDPDKGILRSAPKYVGQRPDRLLGQSDARKVAKMSVRRDGKEVVAYASIVIEQLGTTEEYRFSPADQPYDSVPNQTPAETDGALTPEQNEVWRVTSHARATDEKIIDDHSRRMHPEVKD